MQFDSALPQVDIFESALKMTPLAPHVREHVSRVYQTLLVALASAAVGALIQVRYALGGWLTLFATLAATFWFFLTPYKPGHQQNENKRTGILCLVAFLVGCSLGPGLKMTYDTHGDGYVKESTLSWMRNH